MMTRDILLEMDQEEEDDDDGDIGELGFSGLGRGRKKLGTARGRCALRGGG